MKRKFTTNSRVVTELFAQYPSTFSAFCELINNSIQANSKNIHIDIEYSGEEELAPTLITKIVILDDGEGVALSELDSKILDIGTNVKNGGKGIGRFAALQLGAKIEIESVGYEINDNVYTKFVLPIEDIFFGNGKSVTDLDLSTEESLLETPVSTYYKITIQEFYDQQTIDKNPKKKIAKEFLQANFCNYLFEKYPTKIFNKEVKFYVNTIYINPENYVIGEPEKIKSHYTNKKGEKHDMFFTFFKMNLHTDKIKVFLTVENSGIESVAAGFEYEDNFLPPDLGNYFIYVNSPLFTVDNLRNLDMGDLDSEIKSIRDFIKEKISEKLKEKNKVFDGFIEKLRNDEYNPLKNGKDISESKKSVFEKFAYLVEKEYHLLDKSNPIRELLYSLIERSIANGDLRVILDKINKLDDAFVRRFRELLDKVEIESILEFSERVAKKIEDLQFLEKITCSNISKYVNERKDLHVWLVKMNMMWIFGEQYYDATKLLSDKGLENNLVNLRNDIMKYSRDDEADNYTALENAQIESITDLFMYSEKIIDSENREVIIVELKAPYVKISQKELQQVEKYAFEIGKKQFFPKNIKYNIILISADFNEIVKDKISGTAVHNRKNPYFYWANKEGNIEISVIRWIDLIEGNKRRLKYLSNELEVKDKSVKEKIEQEFGEQEYVKIKSRLTKIKI
jgi:hypothetical protein